MLNQGGGLLDKGAQLIVAPLVARRDDFDHGNDLAMPMAHGDPMGLPRVVFGFGASDEAGARWGFCHGQSSGGCW
jgi:hypothetical protein